MTTPGRRARRKMDPTVIERFDDWRKAKEDRIAELEAALTNLMQKSADHIIAGHPINEDALNALREAERVLRLSS